LKLKDDPRVASTEFFGEGKELMVACLFKKPLACADGLMNYLTRKKGGVPPQKKEPLSNLCFKVHDRIKLKAETTTDFPLELKCSLLISEADMVEANQLEQRARVGNQAQRESGNREMQVVDE